MDLAELKRLHEAATPGPWTAGLDMPEVANNDPDPRLLWEGSMCLGNTKSLWINRQKQEANAAFVAALVSAFPDLLAAVEERDRLKEQVATTIGRLRLLDRVTRYLTE